jgi:UDP-N-acetylmuramate--alanine ligase
MYTRTRALAAEFGEALCVADIVILHDVYPSAREENPGDIDGGILVPATQDAAARAGRHCTVHYEEQVLDALPLAERLVRPGDLFVTMGAGSNWELGRALLDRLNTVEGAR